MNNPPKIFLSPIYFVLYLTVLFIIIRLGILFMFNKQTLFTIDEYDLVLITFDRFIGVPNLNLQWPSTSISILGLPICLTHYLYWTSFKISLTSFTNYINFIYLNPWNILFAFRCIVIVISSIGFASLYIFFQKYTKYWFLSCIGVLLIYSLPEISSYCLIVKGDAVALGFGCMALAVLNIKFNHKTTKMMVSGTLMGLAISSKYTIVLVLPFFFGLILQDNDLLNSLKFLTIFCIFMFLSFIFTCPYIWIDPFRLAKSVWGTASLPGQKLSIVNAINLICQVTTYEIFILGILSFVFIISRQYRCITLGYLTSLLISIYVILKSGYIANRYLFPIIIPFILFNIILFTYILKNVLFNVWLKTLSILAIIVFSMVVIGNNIYQYIAILNNELRYYKKLNIFINDASQMHNGTVIIPFSLFPYFARNASSESLTELANKCKKSSNSGEYISFLATKKILPERVITIFWQTLNEDEQTIASRFYAMAGLVQRNGINLKIWGSEEDALRFGFLTKELSILLFDNKQVSALILDGKNNNIKVNHICGKYHLYKKP